MGLFSKLIAASKPAKIEDLSPEDQKERLVMQEMIENEKKRKRENERKRRSMLIYGNPNMTLKAESIEMEKNHRIRVTNNTLYAKTCKDYFFIDLETNSWYTAFDTILIIFIVYACLTSAFYVSYGFPDNAFLQNMEHVVTGVFTVDIILNFMLLKKNKDGNIIRKHSDIARKYA
jgi:hypothetical protein